MKNLVLIFNHESTENAIKLKKQLSNFFECSILDSGSNLTDNEKSEIDYSFGNIYYNGLINEACKISKEKEADYCTIITSDVTIVDPEGYSNYLKSTIDQNDTGIYMPSCDNSIFKQHLHRKNKGLVKASLSEGFCYTVKVELLDKICPIDLNINRLGFGTSHVLSYVSLRLGLHVYVDHRVQILHPYGSGYSKKEAYKQQMNWMRSLGKPIVLHRYLVGKDYFQAYWFQQVVRLIFFKSKK